MDEKLPDGEKPSNVGTAYGPGAAGREPARVGDAPSGRTDSPAYIAWQAASDAAMAAARRYSPSERGELAARLVDDQAARLPWTPPSYDLTDADFDRARELLDVILDAIEGGRDPRDNGDGVLDRVAAATDLLRGRPKTKADRHLQYARGVAALVARHASPAFDHLYGVERDGLARWTDPAFAALTTAAFRDVIVQAVESVASDPKRKGGATHTGVDHAAARLAVLCGAFESSTGDEAEDVERFKSTLRVTRSNARPKDGKKPANNT